MSVFAIHTIEYHSLAAFTSESITLPYALQLNDYEQNYLCLVVSGRVSCLFKIISSTHESEQSYVYSLSVEHPTEPEYRMLFVFDLPTSPGEPLKLSEIEEKEFLSKVQQTVYGLHYYLMNAEELKATEEKKLIELERKKSKQTSKYTNPIDSPTYKNIKEPHLKAQYILKEIAKIVSLDVMIAKNDQFRYYNNENLGEGSLESFPDYPISKELKKHLEMIDVTYFKDQKPVSCMEVECTTSIASGLLRIADLLTGLELTTFDMYLVTTRDRENKLRKELNRPFFKLTGISQACKVIFLDELEVLYSLILPLSGYIKENVLDRISHTFSEFEQNHYLPPSSFNDVDVIKKGS